jgi:hypothetical protein
MRLKSSREGYLFIDHRASPGLPNGFYRSIGLEGFDVPEGRAIDGATLTCCHCGCIVVKLPDRSRERGHCFKCSDYICDPCVAKGGCTPHVKTLDQAEQRAYRANQNELTTRFSIRKD